MTINTDHFNMMRMTILSAGTENVIRIKKKLSLAIADSGYKSQNGEDPTCRWNLYLDALCNLRLNASSWDDDRIIAMRSSELDMMADWYEAICDVARSVNRRQKDGRGGCNQQKLDTLLDIAKNYDSRVMLLNRPSREYMKYLAERTTQIQYMHQTGNWSRIEKIDCFRGKFI